MLANSVLCNKETIPNEMLALENSKKFSLLRKKKSMHLGSSTSKIHRLEGCGIVNMRSGSRPGILSRALLPTPWRLSTWVSHRVRHTDPAICHIPQGSSWPFAQVSYWRRVLAALETFWTHLRRENVWRTREESILRIERRDREVKKDALSDFPWVIPPPSWLTSGWQRREHESLKVNEHAWMRLCPVVLQVAIFLPHKNNQASCPSRGKFRNK